MEKLIEEWNLVKDNNIKIKQHSVIGKLTHSQILGIEILSRYSRKDSRYQIMELQIILKDVIFKIDPQIGWDICGSFRRECPDSGDIDILMTHPSLECKNDVNDSNILKQVVEILKKDNILIDDLTKNGDTKYGNRCHTWL